MGNPEFNEITLERYISLGSVFITCPKATWPNSFLSTPEFSKAFFATTVPSSIGDTDFSDPPKLPIAVLDPDKITTSSCIKIFSS